MGVDVYVGAGAQATKASISIVPVRTINNLPDRCINPVTNTRKSAPVVAYFIDLMTRNTLRHSLNILYHLLRQDEL